MINLGQSHRSGVETPIERLVVTMLALASAHDIASAISNSVDFRDLDHWVSVAANEMGFQFYALARHPRWAGRGLPPLRMHNYPREWEDRYDQRQLSVCDPVYRASHRAFYGFRWRDAHQLVPIGDRDQEIFEEARSYGIDDGYTVPANMLGELPGSVTFATKVDRPFPQAMLLYAQAFGGMAYQQARVIEGDGPIMEERRITDRQIEVAKWVGRGKSDWEIAQILGVSTCTVSKHVRDLCARFGTSKRTVLVLRAIWSGYLCFSDVFG